MIKLIRVALLAFPLVAAGQSLPVPASTFLKWENLRLVASPDSGELYLWAHFGELEGVGGAKFFATTVDPVALTTWVQGARNFLRQKLDRNDTGAVRISPVLQGTMSRIYVGRRRENGNWSSERILVLERLGDRNPMLFAPKEKDLARILDTLDAVAQRTPPARQGADPLAEGFGPLSEPASFAIGSPAPLFPPGEQVAHREGLVLVRFVVGVDGKADVSTIKVLHATSQPFLESTLDALRKYQFNPASFRGQLVRQALVVPFSFYFKR
jgi:hypothetical protein